MNNSSNDSLKSLLEENRSFSPPDQYRQAAYVNNEQGYEKQWLASVENPEVYWETKARELLSFDQPWSSVLEWNPPHATWFKNAKLNAAVNCLDRHITTDRKNKAAIIWEGESGEQRILTYQNLHYEVCKFSNVLKNLGVSSGDIVTLYMPLIPELAIAMLACARLGAMHSVVFGGFSSDALAERINNAKSTVVITADGGWRRNKMISLKEYVDSAVEHTPLVKHVVVARRTHTAIHFQEGRDHWWHDLMYDASPHHDAESFDSEHPLFILYTSGSTGRPKGVLHTTAGYLLGTATTFKYIFNIQEQDTFWCTADLGWVTGHSYSLYGPLLNGATTVMYEGAPDCPNWGRFWSIIEKYRINILYTAPTAIRSMMKAGIQWPNKYDLSSLKLLGSVGEPINPEAWMWYHQNIGKGRCPIVDTWWQTETGSIMISPIPGVTTTKPGCATKPFFGIDMDIVDKQGHSVPSGQGGYLIVKKPWPSMIRAVYGDEARYQEQYWSQVPGAYFTGDGARRDQDGNIWILGRIDDVINVSGHRLSTMEIESTLVSFPQIAEAAVVGTPHEIKGEAIHCFIVLHHNTTPSLELSDDIKAHVVKYIGSLARPEVIHFAANLPKTRSGKIMRRLLRDIANGRKSVGDLSSLEDISVLAELEKAED